MRRYKRPELRRMDVEEVNEKVFLVGSGEDIWDQGDCFKWWTHQLAQDQAFGRATQVYDIGCKHACTELGVTPIHNNRGQHFIFHLTKQVPRTAKITCDSMTGDGLISEDGWEVMFYRPIMNNPDNESIGISSLTINFVNFPDELLNGLGINGWEVNDIGERTFGNPNDPNNHDYF